MMARALLVVGWMATLGFVATGLTGYLDLDLGLHLMVGLAASLLLLFSHSWIMFFLIGTGKAIKDAVVHHGLDASLVEETRRFKNQSYPALMLAMGAAMATFILGGGVATAAIPGWVHHGLFWLALGLQLRALLIEGRVLAANQRLMADIDRRLAA